VKVAYMVRAVTAGSFTMPGVIAEDMYRTDTFARTGSRQITIGRRN
jgi:alpha-2-macroglobulin